MKHFTLTPDALAGQSPPWSGSTRPGVPAWPHCLPHSSSTHLSQLPSCSGFNIIAEKSITCPWAIPQTLGSRASHMAVNNVRRCRHCQVPATLRNAADQASTGPQRKQDDVKPLNSALRVGLSLTLLQAQDQVQLHSTGRQSWNLGSTQNPLAGEPLPRQLRRAVPTSGSGCWVQAGLFRKLPVTY